jgi:hypothetical protein
LLDGGFPSNVEKLVGSIGTSDVVSVAFPALGKALVIDTRTNAVVRPMVRIMPILGSPQERIRTLGKVRPQLPKIEGLTVIMWPRFVGSLVRLGIWDKLMEWVFEPGGQDFVDTCTDVLEQLRRLENAELQGAVTGENYHTLWQASNRP